MKVAVTYKNIIKTAYPLIIGLVVQNLLNVTDTAFLGQVGAVALGSSALGGLLYLAFFMLAIGFGVGTQILMGRRNGEKDYQAIGKIFNQSLIFLFFLGVIIALSLLIFAPSLLQLRVQSNEILNGSLEYLEYRLLGLIFGLFNIAISAVYIGTLKTRVILISTSINSLINVVFDYAFIFGHFGLPAMGIGGAAIATAISEACTSLYFLVLLLSTGIIKHYSLFKHFSLDWKLMKHLIFVASPVMLIHFLSFSGWFTFFLLVEGMGVAALAASNIARSIYMVLMIPIWGLCSATNTLISNLIGQGEIHKTFLMLRKIITLSLSAAIILICTTIFIPEQIIALYTSDESLIQITKPLLYVIYAALVFFSISMVLFSGISGSGNTRITLIYEVFNISLYVFLTYLFAHVLLVDLYMVWSVEAIYFVSIGIFSAIYLKWGNWRKTII